jgi:multidrug resistance efflux pump
MAHRYQKQMPETENTATKSPITTTKYELRSEEVQEIMSKMPHWIVRRGATVLFILVLLLLAGAYFIHYPDIVLAKVSITSANPPVKLVTQSSGKIQYLPVTNQQMVKADQLIGVIENPADYNQVIELKKWLQVMDTAINLPSAVSGAAVNNFSKLGELQSAYSNVSQAINNYLFFVNNGFYAKKIGQYQSQMVNAGQQKKYLQSDAGYADRQLSIEATRLKRDSILLSQKVISPAEFESRNKDYLNQQRNNNAAGGSMVQNDLNQLEYQKAITDLQQQQSKELNDKTQAVKDLVKRTVGDIAIWEQKYLIKSPVEGKVIFFNYWKENQFVNAGETLVTIVPPVQEYIARAFLPVYGAGKVKANQKTLIKLAAYPYQEFGMLRGKVTAISPVAFDSAFSMEIHLSNGMVTAVNKQIPAQPEYSGIAEILTDDKTIMERLFEKIWISHKR